jgi:heparan-alpha-glucosaminide N-acetyltransferase
VLLQEPSVAVTGAAVSPRVTSIDIFRGLTMALMIFVNELSSIKGLPWWNYHMPENANGMTYVDMVFPAFLFILGMSVPLAVEQRLKKGASMGQL